MMCGVTYTPTQEAEEKLKETERDQRFLKIARGVTDPQRGFIQNEKQACLTPPPISYNKLYKQ